MCCEIISLNCMGIDSLKFNFFGLKPHCSPVPRCKPCKAVLLFGLADFFFVLLQAFPNDTLCQTNTFTLTNGAPSTIRRR